jgi:hypothetical protein
MDEPIVNRSDGQASRIMAHGCPAGTDHGREVPEIDLLSPLMIEATALTSDGGMKLLDEMEADALLRPGPWGGDHAMWIARHLAVIEGRLHKMLHRTPNPVEHWKPLFDWGSEPQDDPSAYPPYEEVQGVGPIFQSILPSRTLPTAPPDSSIACKLLDLSRAKHPNAAPDGARSPDATPRASAPTRADRSTAGATSHWRRKRETPACRAKGSAGGS